MTNTNRRGFLGRVGRGALGVTALCGIGAVRVGSAHWRMKLSGSSINFSKLPIEQVCERFATLGFEAIDIWCAYAGCPHLDDVQQRLGADGLKELLGKNHLALNAFSVYVGGYPRYAELLGKAGGGVAITGSEGPCEPKDLTPRMKAFLESLKPQIELAEKYHSYLAIENHGGSLLSSIDSIRAFGELNSSKRLGIALAPFHIQAGGEDVPKAIEAAGSNLLFFYAWQHDPAMSTKQLPGIGPTDCGPWLEALAKIGYTRYVNPFLHSEPPPDVAAAALARSRDYLKACYEKAVPG